MKRLIPVIGLLFAGLLYVGCSEDYLTQSSNDLETVLPEASGGEGVFVGKKGGGNAPDAYYTVTINVPGFGHGEALDAPGSGNNIGEATMVFTFEEGLLSCPSTPDGPVAVTGVHTIMLRQNRRNPGPFTYGQASLWGFDVEGVQGFELDIDESLLAPGWLPAPDASVILTGGFGGAGGDLELWNRRKAHECNKTIPNYWEITVTGNPL